MHGMAPSIWCGAGGLKQQKKQAAQRSKPHHHEVFSSSSRIFAFHSSSSLSNSVAVYRAQDSQELNRVVIIHEFQCPQHIS